MPCMKFLMTAPHVHEVQFLEAMNRFKSAPIINFFKRQPPPFITTTTSCNSAINRLSSLGSHSDVLFTFSYMLLNGIPPDSYTFPSLLKACTSLNLFSLGLLVHQHVISNGFSSDSYIASSLINFYAHFGHVLNSRILFDNMPERNVVPWSAMIGCYSKWGDVNASFWMFDRMRDVGVRPSSVTLLGMLFGVYELDHAKCLHGSAIVSGLIQDLSLTNSFVNVYGRCGGLEDARGMFECMDERDRVSWNSMVSVYAQVGNVREVVELVKRVRSEGVGIDQQTLGSIVAVAAMSGEVSLGRLVHGWVVSGGCEMDAHLVTSLIVMYLKCRNVNDAFLVFERTVVRDAILWTAMISGLAQNDCADISLSTFRWMIKSGVMPSTVTLASALAACAQAGALNQGMSIHGYIFRRRMMADVAAQNALITLYAKFGILKQSCAVFTGMDARDVVSWNAVVAGFAENGDLYSAFVLFIEMRTTLLWPDSITVVSLLQGCARLGALHQGKWIHNFIIRSCLGPCMSINTALLDMYCKCGDLEAAQKLFSQNVVQDVISWSAIIAGYGSHGKGEIALKMYSEFLQTGIEPNHVTFLAVLSACCHNGFINEGLRLYHSMAQDYGILARLEHNACIVDLLSRAGRIEEAYIFYKKTFPEPNADVLGIVLDGCRGDGNEKIGYVISEEILNSKPTSSGNYVQLAHKHASGNRWDGVGEAWVQMRSLGLKKIPGWSYIELHGIIETFFSCHTSHPQYKELVATLECLYGNMRKRDICSKLKNLGDYIESESFTLTQMNCVVD